MMLNRDSDYLGLNSRCPYLGPIKMKRYFWLSVTVFAAFVAVIIILITIAMYVWKGGAPEERLPAEAPYREPEAFAKLALVLDDFGYTMKNLTALKDIKVPLTLGVLPGTPYSEAVCSFAKQNNMEVILHMPMEPEPKAASLEENTILVDMNDEVIRDIVSRALLSVTGAKGASNHMGSKATRDARVLRIVFEELKKKKMFFLDSLTTNESVCLEVAENAGIPCIERDVFIDNEPDDSAIMRQVKKAGKIARLYGKAVAVGHDREATIRILRKAVPAMAEEGIRFVKLSETVEEYDHAGD